MKNAPAIEESIDHEGRKDDNHHTRNIEVAYFFVAFRPFRHEENKCSGDQRTDGCNQMDESGRISNEVIHAGELYFCP